MDPAKVPEPLRHLIPLVQKWGATASDTERYAVADAAEADEQNIAELERFVASWTDEAMRTYEEWSDRTKLVDSPEFAKFYFMFHLLDELEIRFPQRQYDPVEAAIKDLQKMQGISAAAQRMDAARRLGERGVESKAAVPVLLEKTNDPEPHVRAWAHAALALIVGNAEEHRRAIRDILSSPISDEIDRMSVEEAIEELDRTPSERALRRLIGAAITNDVATIRALTPIVDVNSADKSHNQTPVDLAVGNGHPEAVRALLEAGANPNQRDRFGNRTLLHNAALRRTGGAIIRLLLDHGADPTLRDKDGRTPLDLAREAGRKANCKLLEAASM